jgi:survival-of-motor-neuron-related-splicing factor 30
VVEVRGGDRPYAGVVTGFIDNATARIKYFEFDAEVSLPLTSLVRLPGAAGAAPQLNRGGLYECKYATDGQWYDATVTALTAHGCQVTYTLYGNSEEVPVAYLRSKDGVPPPPPPATAAATHTNAKPAQQQQDKALVPLAIPENLKILPTDTEEEKAKKKKKLKAIKSKNRLISKEADIVAVQQTWQKFVSKKKPVGSTLVTKKTSMFSTTENGKVGVINSGKGVTEFVQRQKHKF